MSESLNVIALISGGKDSFYSILHCLQNGHKVVALGNLYPSPPSASVKTQEVDAGPSTERDHVNPVLEEDEYDLNSFMYQTVGHTIIPLYEEALGIPLYRQQILGTAVHTGLSYQASKQSQTASSQEDETESLLPLLRMIMAAHPEANALSTGAILSTYQRTRIESVAIRMGLIPLSHLWQYPFLPPQLQISLLQDMQNAGMDARIIKVASGGLDESFLWEKVASVKGMMRIEKAMKRFGMDGDGAVLGEGGEFETLVVDGPRKLFRGRIVAEESQQRVIREGGGSSWLAFGRAKVEIKGEEAEDHQGDVRTPDMLDEQFIKMLSSLVAEPMNREPASHLTAIFTEKAAESEVLKLRSAKPIPRKVGSTCHRWTITARKNEGAMTIEKDMEDIMEQARLRLQTQNLRPRDIVSTIIILRSMADFAAVNKIYGALFDEPNPPARVTIACGDSLPEDSNVIIHWKLNTEPKCSSSRRGLHVQSRSYWAPANIGPYSQAQAVPLLNIENSERAFVFTVDIAGQIPLIPATMMLPSSETVSEFIPAAVIQKIGIEQSDFYLQAVLSLQHLWRIGLEMDVSWWSSAVVYLSRDSISNIAAKARMAGAAWAHQHSKAVTDEDDDAADEERDLWEERYHGGLVSRGGNRSVKQLPDWSLVESDQPTINGFVPPFFAAEVMELPRGSAVEWHAHVGLTGGLVKVSMHARGDIGSVYECVVGDAAIYTVVMIPYQPELPDLKERVVALMASGGKRTTTDMNEGDEYEGVYASYIDANVKGPGDMNSLAGLIHCRSLWTGEGVRLAAVLLFETESPSRSS